MRHLVTFLLFYTSVLFFYRLCKYRFGSWKIGLLGSLFLILSPRIFAHSFYNSKDIACLAMFIISIYTLLKYLDKKNLSTATFHVLTCALLIDIRIVGIIVPFLTFIFLIADLLVIKRIEGKRIMVSFLIYMFLLIFSTILFWPVLWKNPFYHFISAFKEMSRYDIFSYPILSYIWGIT
ncbi:MAG: glycosyltransferase family 39 protein [bacterium]